MVLVSFILGYLFRHLVGFNCEETCCCEPKGTVSTKAASIAKDDLKKVEGIGPKIEQLLNADGIYSFSQLADTEVTRLKSILDKAGERFRMHDPSSWNKQAEFARDGQWDNLGKYQEQLSAGRA